MLCARLILDVRLGRIYHPISGLCDLLRLLAPAIALVGGVSGCATMPDRRYAAEDLRHCLGLSVDAAVKELRLDGAEHSVMQEPGHRTRGVTHYIADGGWVSLFVDATDPSLPPPVVYDPNLKYDQFRRATVVGIEYIRKGDHASVGNGPAAWHMGDNVSRKVVITDEEWEEMFEGDENDPGPNDDP